MPVCGSATKSLTRGGVPVIAARHAASIVQALLHDGPFAVRGQDETMEVDLKPVGDRIVVDARGQAAGAHQRFAVESATVGDRAQFLRRVARKSAAAAANVDAELVGARRQTALQRAHDRCRDARGVPVHAHHRAQRLKPKGIAQSRQESRGAVIVDDGFGDRGAEFGHAFGEPLRHAAAMQRQICDSGAFHIVILRYLVRRPNQSSELAKKQGTRTFFHSLSSRAVG